MANYCSIIMYHYVRDLKNSRYPGIKGLDIGEFIAQLEYMQKYYTFITVEELLSSFEYGKKIPKNSALLTFDDAYIDHFTNVFPVLNSKGIQGCFFPPSRAVLDNVVLDVNKIHFILANNSNNYGKLIKFINNCLDTYRSEYNLESNDYYFSKLAVQNRFDSKEVIFIKRLLQVELPEELRKKIVKKLFLHFVTDNEKSFAKEIYMSMDQIKCLKNSGMYIGGHGYSHCWLNYLSESKQRIEIDKTLEFLDIIGSDVSNWIMCYPYGGYNESLISILKEKNCKLGITTQVDIAQIEELSRYRLPRLDTNDLPKEAFAEPNNWTKRVRF